MRIATMRITTDLLDSMTMFAESVEDSSSYPYGWSNYQGTAPDFFHVSFQIGGVSLCESFITWSNLSAECNMHLHVKLDSVKVDRFEFSSQVCDFALLMCLRRCSSNYRAANLTQQSS